MPAGKTLRIEAQAPAKIHWSSNGWQAASDLDAQDCGFGIYTADLPTRELVEGAEIVFTFYWPLENRWEGKDYTVRVKSF